jgi:hypothetical protein
MKRKIAVNHRYHPRMMTKILLYGYCVGVYSSRRIQKHLVEDVAFRVLAAGNQPDFRTIADFRKLHLRALEELFQQVLRLVLEVGALKLGRVALDGSKVRANASKHKAMSYGRMEESEKLLRKEVQKLLKQAETADEEEDKRYGRDRRGDELPEELQRRETRIARIQEAKKALEERARVEPLFQLVVGQTVTQATNDKQQMVPLIEAIEEQSGQRPKEVLTDSGYCSEENLKYLVREGWKGSWRRKNRNTVSGASPVNGDPYRKMPVA